MDQAIPCSNYKRPWDLGTFLTGLEGDTRRGLTENLQRMDDSKKQKVVGFNVSLRPSFYRKSPICSIASTICSSLIRSSSGKKHLSRSQDVFSEVLRKVSRRAQVHPTALEQRGQFFC